MVTKTRVPTNCINSIEDAQALVSDAWTALTAASERIETRFPYLALLVAMNQLTRALSGVEYHLRNARHNIYQDRRTS